MFGFILVMTIYEIDSGMNNINNPRGFIHKRIHMLNVVYYAFFHLIPTLVENLWMKLCE